MQLCTHPHTALLPGVIQGYQTIAVMFQVFFPSNSLHKEQKCLPKSYASITKWFPLPEQQSRYTIKLQKTFYGIKWGEWHLIWSDDTVCSLSGLYLMLLDIEDCLCSWPFNRIVGWKWIMIERFLPVNFWAKCQCFPPGRQLTSAMWGLSTCFQINLILWDQTNGCQW